MNLLFTVLNKKKNGMPLTCTNTDKNASQKI